MVTTERVGQLTGHVLFVTLEGLELLEGSDVEHADGLISRTRRDEMTVWVPLAREDGVLVQVAEATKKEDHQSKV